MGEVGMYTLAGILAVAALAGAAHADTPAEQAKAHAAIAERMFAAQQYDKAIGEMQQAYVLDPQPDYLYAIAQGFRLSGDCTRAIRGYKEYLKTKPAAAQADKAQQNIDRCKTEPAPATQAPQTTMLPAPVAATPAPAPAPAPAPSDTTSSTWTHDYVGHALVGGGAGFAIVGTVLYLSGKSTVDSINSSPSYETYAMRRDDASGAELKEKIGIGLSIAGVALVVGGVFHYRMSTSTHAQTVSAMLGPDRVGIAIAGAF